MGKSMLRWGILGTAEIAKKNWKAIWNTKNGRVAAVASRDIERSYRFIEECQAEAGFETTPKALGSYEELLGSKDIDAVYIPLPTAIRKAWVERAAEAGKHVVCEKPCAVSLADLGAMLESCRRNQVQFMDGVMFMHSSRLERLREVLDDGQTIGAVRRITSAFTFKAPEEFFISNIRARSELEPHGCLGDLGWYCIRFALWTQGWNLPRRVAGRALSQFQHPDSKLPVPTEFSAELIFDGGVTSAFYCSFLSEIEQWVNISGTRGSLKIPDFVLPFSGSELAFETANPVYTIFGCDFKMEPFSRRWTLKEHSHGHSSSQETNLFRHFVDRVLAGTLNPAWPEMAFKTQLVMEACLESSRAHGQEREISSKGCDYPSLKL